MNITTHVIRLNLLAVILILGGCVSSQPKLSQDQILEQYPQVTKLDSAVKSSKSKGADLYAPEGYKKANDSLKDAMDAARDNDKKDADKAATAGLKTIDKVNSDTQKSLDLLSEVNDSRERAISAGVLTLQADELAEMDKKLIATSTLIEEGKIEDAKQQRAELIQGYTQLELSALKVGTTELAKSAIANAKKNEAEKYAPKTLAEAEKSLGLAVSTLESDRTQTEKANVHASNAKLLADKSASITETIKDFDRRDYSREDAVLWYHRQLSTIHKPIGGQLPFDTANDDMVQTFKTDVAQLKATEIEYKERLASTEKESSVMLAKERERKANFDKVQSMFTAEEANVFRKQQDVLISAHGFDFPSGKSEIQTDNFSLMNKLKRAIDIFPNSRIEITGHTDSTGSDKANLSLSQARAENVGKFLVEAGEISSDRIKTAGYGESRPVAANTTTEGRAENRRVEINIINE